MIAGRRRRQITGMVVLASLVAAVAVAVPLVLQLGDDDFEFENADVVAATRYRQTIAKPVMLLPRTGFWLTRGQLAVAAPQKKTMTLANLRGLLSDGLADLVIQRGEMRLGDTFRFGTSTVDRSLSPALRALREGKFASLHVIKTTVHVLLPNGLQEQLRITRATFARVGKLAIRGAGTANWRGQRVAFSLKSDGNAGTNDDGMPFELRVKALLFSVELTGFADGENGLRLTGNMRASSEDFRKLVRTFGALWPGRFGMRKVSIDGPFAWIDKGLSMPQSAVRLDDNEGSGAIAVGLNGSKPMISGTLAFQKFDLQSFLSLRNPADDRFTSDLAQAVFGDFLKRFASLWLVPMAHTVDADLRLSAKSIRLGSSEFGSIATAFSLKNGKALFNIAELKLKHGEGTGQLSVDYNGLLPRVAFRGRLNGVELGQLCQTLFGTPLLSGRGTVSADVTAQGETLPQLLAGLNGAVETELPGRGQVRLDLHRLARLPAVDRVGAGPDSPIPDATPTVAAAKIFAGITPIEGLSASLVLSGGMAELRHARLRFDDRSMQVHGRFDLKGQQVAARTFIAQANVSAPNDVAAASGSQSKMIDGILTDIRGSLVQPRFVLSMRRVDPDGLHHLLDVN